MVSLDGMTQAATGRAERVWSYLGTPSQTIATANILTHPQHHGPLSVYIPRRHELLVRIGDWLIRHSNGVRVLH